MDDTPTSDDVLPNYGRDPAIGFRWLGYAYDLFINVKIISFAVPEIYAGKLSIVS